MHVSIMCRREEKEKMIPLQIRTSGFWVVSWALGPVWYVCLKTENCCLKIFVEIRVGEKVY